METSLKQILANGADALTSLPPDSPVSPSRWPDEEKERKMTASSGRRCAEHLPKSDPPFFVGENVAGITSMVFPGEEINVETQASLFEAPDVDKIREQRFIIEDICQDLENLEYKVQPVAIPACAVGAPHLRMRIYFLAYSASYAGERRRHGETQKTDAMPDRQRDVPCEPQSRNIGEIGVAADACLIGFKIRGTDGGCKKKSTIIREISHSSNKRYGSEWLASDAHSDSIQTGRELNELLRKTSTCDGGIIAFDTQCGRWEQDNENRFSEQPEQGIPDWSGFPTQSPLCRRDDGISQRLDAITFPSWRGKSIEGYGNAIVPQVMYEIFKGIEAVRSL